MLNRRMVPVLLAMMPLTLSVPAHAAETVADVLHRQTQALFDALVPGNAAVWEKYLDADVRYGDENGAVMTKKEMVDGIKPFPKGVSGTIRVIDFNVVLHGNVAVATHIDDEDEDYHGAKLHCQYRGTDTWIKKADGWKLIADQTLALRTDPPAIPTTASRRAEYCGRYGFAPDVTYEIRCKDNALEGQQSGRKAEELRAEAPDVLFSPGKPRYRMIFERDKDGRITGFAERREAWDIVWKRLP